MIEHKGYTFICTRSGDHPKLEVQANTERTAIQKARAKHWDVVRVRIVSGLQKPWVARTVRVDFCPGCAWDFGARRP